MIDELVTQRIVVVVVVVVHWRLEIRVFASRRSRAREGRRTIARGVESRRRDEEVATGDDAGQRALVFVARAVAHDGEVAKGETREEIPRALERDARGHSRGGDVHEDSEIAPSLALDVGETESGDDGRSRATVVSIASAMVVLTHHPGELFAVLGHALIHHRRVVSHGW